MFSTANRTPEGLAADPLGEASRVVALPPERRVHDDGVGPQPMGRLDRHVELAPRVVAPGRLGHQQAGRVDRAHRDAVVVAQLLHRVDVGRDGIDADHQLHPVVAQAGGDLEAARRGLGVDRRGRQQYLGPDGGGGHGHVTT
jgi:hypothetical protein